MNRWFVGSLQFVKTNPEVVRRFVYRNEPNYFTSAETEGQRTEPMNLYPSNTREAGRAR